MKVVKVKDREELQKILDDDETYEQEYDEYEIRNTEAIGDDMIGTCGQPYYLEDLGLLVIEGTYFNNEDGEFMADWSLTLVYEWDSDKTEFTQDDVANYDYFEQDPPITALHNYLWYKTPTTEPEKSVDM